MVGHVKVVAILMIVFAALIALMGLFLIVVDPFLFPLMSSAPAQSGPSQQEKTVLTTMAVLTGTLGCLLLVVAILNVVAAIRAFQFRNRGLILVALFGNVLSIFTGYCTAFGLGVMVFGLIVFFNRDVIEAFDRVARGESPEEVIERFERQSRRERPSERWERQRRILDLEDEGRPERRRDEEPDDRIRP